MIVFIGLCLVVSFVFGALLAGLAIRRLLSRSVRERKSEVPTVYECGEPVVGTAMACFNSRFYNVALVYILFDVELILLFPILMVFREYVYRVDFYAVFTFIFFVFVLLLGLIVEWRFSNLEWRR